MNDAMPASPHPAECSEKPVRAASDVAQAGAGPIPHAPTREPLRGFEWPCEKRTAHDPHDDCPGVKAHPNTMIGKR